MTTIAVVKKNGTVAIAADSMTSWRLGKDTAKYIVNNPKIVQIDDSFLAVCGPGSGKLVLKNYFAQIKDDVQLESVEAIFETWLALHSCLKSEYYLNLEDDKDACFESSRMDVLIANPHGIFGVAAHRSIQEFSRFYALGSGGEYAMGAMYTVYEDADRSAQEIAELGVRAGAEFDDSSGLPIVSFAIALAG